MNYDGQEVVTEASTAFMIDNVDEEAASSGETRERREVPPGQYDVQVQLIRPNVYTDKKGFKKQMLPLEVSEGEYQGEWIRVYLWLSNQDSADGKTRDGISRGKVAMIAKALGITKMTDFHDIAGKFVSVKYGPNARGYNEILEATPLGAMSAEPEESDEIPF